LSESRLALDTHSSTGGTIGFERPSAIQQRAIVPISKGRDTICQAQSGTGKTATLSISCLQTIDTTLREVQALVLSPTRELASQIQKVIMALGDSMNVLCHCCIGGTAVGEDVRKLDQGVHIVSGTPGRVFDMIRRRSLRTRNVKLLVLDEADEMLSKGFKDQIYDVYRYLPPSTQVPYLVPRHARWHHSNSNHAPTHIGGRVGSVGVCDAAARGARDDDQVHDRPDPHSRQAR